jgi:hypothetical protein
MLGIVLKYESCYKKFYKTFVEKKIKGHQVYGDKEEHGFHVYFQFFFLHKDGRHDANLCVSQFITPKFWNPIGFHKILDSIILLS